MHRVHILTLGTIVFLLIGVSVVYSHPADGLPTADLEQGYGSENFGVPAEWSIGDLKFTRPYPEISELTDTERYMLAGTNGSSDSYGFEAWWREVFTYVTAYDKKFGQIPEVFSPSLVQEVSWQPETVDENAEFMQRLRNPISGEYPKLKASQFSAGDMYIRRLTDDEIRHFAEKDIYLRTLWFQKKEIIRSTEGEVKDARLITPVYYLRLYGEHGVILSRLVYDFALIEDTL